MTILSWHIEFVRPLGFALLAALPLLLIFWRWSLVRASSSRKVVSLVLRSFLLLLVAAALAEPKATESASQAIFDCKRQHSRGADSPPALEIVAPDHIRAGEPFSLKAILQSNSTGTATVELLRNSQPLVKQSFPLVAGENQAIFHPSIIAPQPGVSGGRFGRNPAAPARPARAARPPAPAAGPWPPRIRRTRPAHATPAPPR